MSDTETDAGREARFTVFAVMGALTTVQEIAGTVLESVDGADPDLVAEETLALVATATARTARALGFPAAALAIAAMPLAYRDYLAGGALLDGSPTLADDGTAYERLARKMAFYDVHLPPDAVPGVRLLEDKMALWMGRVSPPGLKESPQVRLGRLDLPAMLARHVRLVAVHAGME